MKLATVRAHLGRERNAVFAGWLAQERRLGREPSISERIATRERIRSVVTVESFSTGHPASPTAKASAVPLHVSQPPRDEGREGGVHILSACWEARP
jgi:hypothetical protein